MGTVPGTGGAFGKKEGTEGIQKSAQSLCPGNALHLLNTRAEDFHVLVMVMQIVLIPSIIHLLRMFSVSATRDTKMIHKETLKSLHSNRKRDM